MICDGKAVCSQGPCGARFSTFAGPRAAVPVALKRTFQSHCLALKMGRKEIAFVSSQGWDHKEAEVQCQSWSIRILLQIQQRKDSGISLLAASKLELF